MRMLSKVLVAVCVVALRTSPLKLSLSTPLAVPVAVCADAS